MKDFLAIDLKSYIVIGIFPSKEEAKRYCRGKTDIIIYDVEGRKSYRLVPKVKFWLCRCVLWNLGYKVTIKEAVFASKGLAIQFAIDNGCRNRDWQKKGVGLYKRQEQDSYKISPIKVQT